MTPIKVLPPISTIGTITAAREVAVEWQEWATDQALAYSDLAYYGEYFKALADKFNLTDEFKENGII